MPPSPPHRILNLLRPLASLRLTVALMALAMVLIFLGTLAQTQRSTFAVQEEYFHSLFVLAELGQWKVPLPGGYALGAGLLLNLIAAHVVHFQASWKRVGIILLHGGIALLLVGELFTSLFAVEMRMDLKKGQPLTFAHDIRHVELAVVDRSPPEHDQVVVYPQALLHQGAVLSHPDLPLTLKVQQYFQHTRFLGPGQQQAAADAMLRGNPATHGVGRQMLALDAGSHMPAENVAIPSAYVTVLGKDGKTAGTWLLSMVLGKPQLVVVDAKAFYLELRPRRYHQPFAVRLEQFAHEKHTGTEKPKSFTSWVKVLSPEGSTLREAAISMNNPLRFAGLTFYQSGFNPEDPDMTILQVVRNPNWFVPYLACVIVSLGMLIHFLLGLSRFTRRRTA